MNDYEWNLINILEVLLAWHLKFSAMLATGQMEHIGKFLPRLKSRRFSHTYFWLPSYILCLHRTWHQSSLWRSSSSKRSGHNWQKFQKQTAQAYQSGFGQVDFFCLFLVSASEVNCQNSLQKNPLCEKTFPSWDQEKRELLEWSRPLSCSGRSKVVRRWWLGWSYYRKTNFQLVCHQSLGCRQRRKREWRRSRHLLRLCALGGCSSRPCCQCRLKMLELCLNIYLQAGSCGIPGFSKI